MLRTTTHKTVTSLVLGVACLALPSVSYAGHIAPLSGSIAGSVKDPGGKPQLGAVVQLLNHQERVIDRVLTDERGEFKILGLLPNFYSIKVTVASFVPAIKKDILVQPGMRSVLNVNLSTLFSSIQLSYPTLDNGSIMSDDWKWVLRSANATRPVMRLLDEDPNLATAEQTRTAMFSGTRGMLRVSAGDRPVGDLAGNPAGLGTAFALATSVYGANNLQVMGDVGYGTQLGAPAAAFRTSYSRNWMGESPELSVTMRQLSLPGRFGAAVSGQDSGLPALRTMSAALDNHSELAENLSLQYGFAMDCISFLDHLNYFSPYARLTYQLGEGSEIEFAYTSGNARPDLARYAADEEDLQRGFDTLDLFPRVSMLGGQSKVQRGQEYEIGYARKIGSRKFEVSAYRESVSNLALSLVAPQGLFGGADLLPDIFSGNSIFNAGNFDTVGFSAGVTQNFGDHLSATVIYGSTGALTTDRHELVSNSPDELRSMIYAGRRHAATTRVTGSLPWTGTHFIASYQWAAGGDRWMDTGNLYSTHSMRPLPGFNILIRQPIPGLGRRIEATADLRNLLAQGYLGISTLQNQQLLLVENPRSVRGGLSFIF